MLEDKNRSFSEIVIFPLGETMDSMNKFQTLIASVKINFQWLSFPINYSYFSKKIL